MDERKGMCITILCQSLCLRVPKFFVGQIFCVSGKIGYRKTLRIIRALHYYLLILFCSAVPKSFVRKHFGVSESFWFRQFFLMREVGVCHNFFPKFLPHSTEKNRTGTLLCFGKKPVSKKRTVNKGTSLLSVDTFLFHSAKKNRAETVRCFRKYLVSQMFFDKRRRGCITIFCQSLCLRVPKFFVGQIFCVSGKIGYRKTLRIIRALHYYLMILFCSAVPKNFVRKHFGVSENVWFRKFLLTREDGVCHDFFPNFCLKVPKKLVREPFCVSEKNRYQKTYG